MRMYFNFLTNLRNSKDDVPTPQVDGITFLTNDGMKIRIGCNWQSDWGVSDGEFNARYKGLEFYIENENGETILEYEEPSKEQLDSLKTATPIDIHFFIDDDCGYEDSFIPICKNIHISIDTYDEIFEYNADELFDSEYQDKIIQ